MKIGQIAERKPAKLPNKIEKHGRKLVVSNYLCYFCGINKNIWQTCIKNALQTNGLECDAIVHLRNGSYGLIEIKLGGDNLIEEGATSLKELSNKVDTTKMKSPAFMMVLTAIGSYAYQREDSVWVVPIGSLKD